MIHVPTSDPATPPPPSTPAPTPLPTQWARAIANALWPNLRRDQWTPHRQLTSHSSTGNPRTGRDYHPTPAFTNPRDWELQPHPGPELLKNEKYILTYLWPEEWHERKGLRIHLLQTDHHRTLETLTPEQHFDFTAALKLSRCRAPFHNDTNRHKTPRLRRNDADGLITPAAAQALEAIAAAADVQVLSDELLDALLTAADEIPDVTVIERAADG